MYKTLPLLALTILLLSCGSNNVGGVNGDAPVAPMASDPDVIEAAAFPTAVSEPWRMAVLDYVALKNAFVASDLTTAKVKANDLAQRLGAADMSAMGAGHDAWMSAAVPVQRSAEAIASAATLDAARANFEQLTTPVITAVKALGDGGQDLFVQYCPMALRDSGEGAPLSSRGASWVATEREVRNPYFGDAMLKCGKVTEEL